MQIPHHIAEGHSIEILVYDLAGQVVRRLVDGTSEGRFDEVIWYRTDEEGSSVSAGFYLVVMRSDSGISTRKALFVK